MQVPTVEHGQQWAPVSVGCNCKARSKWSQKPAQGTSHLCCGSHLPQLTPGQEKLLGAAEHSSAPRGHHNAQLWWHLLFAKGCWLDCMLHSLVSPLQRAEQAGQQCNGIHPPSAAGKRPPRALMQSVRAHNGHGPQGSRAPNCHATRPSRRAATLKLPSREMDQAGPDCARPGRLDAPWLSGSRNRPPLRTCPTWPSIPQAGQHPMQPGLGGHRLAAAQEGMGWRLCCSRGCLPGPPAQP